MGIRFEKGIARCCCHRENIRGRAYKTPDGTAHHAPRQGGKPAPPGRDPCSTLPTKRHKSRSRTREREAVEGHGKCKTCGAAAAGAGRAVAQPTVCTSRESVTRDKERSKHVSQFHAPCSRQAPCTVHDRMHHTFTGPAAQGACSCRVTTHVCVVCGTRCCDGCGVTRWRGFSAPLC